MSRGIGCLGAHRLALDAAILIWSICDVSVPKFGTEGWIDKVPMFVIWQYNAIYLARCRSRLVMVIATWLPNFGTLQW